ncbi:DUF2255 family protein [Actinophytocola sp.]|uniref:DUF2255 family protein n=1 Tax=Actinophytocola sp. TaxID=1872138 RepID=UPI002D693F0E|nr:DUF2255 family protein [Actinophytocola sp.]HYQ64837.1 DUF2255 family protein [Actinophytocola sp.]
MTTTPMTQWTDDELTSLRTVDELEIAGRRDDGTLRRPRTIWVVEHDGHAYVRSVNGATAAWYRGTRTRGEGHVTVGTVDRDVAFVDAVDDEALNDVLDAVYRDKYRRYAANTVEGIIGPDARATTMRLVPRNQGD